MRCLLRSLADVDELHLCRNVNHLLQGLLIRCGWLVLRAHLLGLDHRLANLLLKLLQLFLLLLSSLGLPILLENEVNVCQDLEPQLF